MIPVCITAPVVAAALIAIGLIHIARIEAGSAALPTDDEGEK